MDTAIHHINELLRYDHANFASDLHIPEPIRSVSRTTNVMSFPEIAIDEELNILKSLFTKARPRETYSNKITTNLVITNIMPALEFYESGSSKASRVFLDYFASKLQRLNLTATPLLSESFEHVGKLASKEIFGQYLTQMFSRHEWKSTPDTYELDDGALVLDFVTGANRIICILRKCYAHILGNIDGKSIDNLIEDDLFNIENVAIELKKLVDKAAEDRK